MIRRLGLPRKREGIATMNDENTPATPARVVPTEPGWWWENGQPPSPRYVMDRGDTLIVNMRGTGVPVDSPDFDWLAPIPPPAECAAWAANGRPSAAVLKALGSFAKTLVDCDGAPYGSDEREYAFDEWKWSQAGLLAAIRAERAAQGSAPAVMPEGHVERWIVRLSCCGRDDGVEVFDTWKEANAFRESYVSGQGKDPHGYSGTGITGHQRAGIISWIMAQGSAPAGQEVGDA